MPVPLLTDLRNDSKLKKNFLRLGLFLAIVIVADYLFSVILLKGIEKNYGLKSDAGILLIGHSHLMLAIDKQLLENKSGLKVAKYTREGVNISDRRIMVRHYFTTCSEKPGFVIMSIDPWIFTGEGLSTNSYTLFLPFMDNIDVNNYIKESVPQKFDYLKARWIRSSRFNSTLLNASIRGYLSNWNNLKIGVIDSVKLKNELSSGNYRHITVNYDLLNDFSATLEYLRKENVKVILLNTPVYNPVIANQEKEYQQVMQTIDSVANSKCREAILVDLVPLFSEKSSLFFDPIHLNPQGQHAVTEYFSAVLDSIIAGSK